MVISGTSTATGTTRLRGKEAFACVWSHGSGCDAYVPADVVIEAWRNDMELARQADGFFHFEWDGGMWLGYGLPDGSVRGVYCAAHCAERARHVGVIGPPARGLTLVTSSRDVTVA